MLPRRTFLAALTASATLGLVSRARADQPMYFSRGGAVINGYDPVAYFREGKPVKGSKEFALMWKGGTWLFSSAENRLRFEMNPRLYAPQYGGYCAYAVSRGYTAKTEPEAWRIVDGKLYLNFSLSVRGLWEADVPGHIRSANANWPAVLTE